MKSSWLIRAPLLLVVLSVAVFLSCGKKPEPQPEPKPIAEVRPPDISTAVEIPESPYKVIPNELVVLLKDGETVESFSKAVAGTNVKVIGYIPEFRVVQVEVPATEREALKEELKRNPVVKDVTHQWIFRSNVKLNDPVLTNDDPQDDWGLQAIGAEAAWDITRGDPSVIIAVVDAGVLLDHEELKDKIVAPASLFSDDGSQVGGPDNLFHGTHVAIIAAGAGNNGVGTSGVCPNCRIMPVQVGDGYGSTVTNGMAGVEYAILNGAKVINISMAPTMKEYLVRDYQDPSQRDRIQSQLLDMRREFAWVNEVFAYAERLGVTVVVGGGNDNVPGDFNAFCHSPFTLGVGAVGLDPNGALVPADFSNYGYTVRVSAPGVNIYSGNAEPGGHGYEWLQGTSMATPYVSGLAALIASANRDLKPHEIRQAIIASAFADTPAQSPRVRWYQPAREVNLEMDLWRRAFLLLLNKDDGQQLDDITQTFLLSLIPPDYNTVWDGPFVQGKGAGDKAVGAFIDARAALEMATSGAFQKEFALFTKAEIEKAKLLKPEQLLQIYNMLKLAGRYAGSGDVGGPFTLELKTPSQRLEVVRELNPGGDYSEWLEYIAPGRYRHFARFGGEDYSQGLVYVQRKDKALEMRNLRRDETISYPLAE